MFIAEQPDLADTALGAGIGVTGFQSFFPT